MDVGAWLRGLGLGQYEQAFRDNAVEAEVLPELGEADLERLGVVPLGHRKRLLKAIAALPGGTAGAMEPPPTPEAERRQLTVMFCDLVNSTALSARLDPEDMRELLRAYQDAVAGAVARYEGVVAKLMGDGVLAYFGFPQAHEDDPERAARAALDVVGAVARLRAPEGAPLAVRVGVATGLVVVGDLVGKGAAQELAVVGETPNLAARLQALAEPGSVAVADATRRLLGGLFELSDLGERSVKGIAEPVRAWRVLEARAVGSRFEARQGGGPLPLVGRDRELALLRDRWRQCKAGEAQAVLLVGEAGVGKSRLARALLDEIAAEPHLALVFQCSPFHRGSALWPVVERLGAVVGLGQDQDRAARLAKVEAFVRQVPAAPPDAAPLLADLLGVDAEGRYQRQPATPSQRRARTLGALGDVLVGLAAREPLLLALEDAHWSDPTTLELVEEVLARGRRARLLLLVTSRPDEDPPALAGRGEAATLSLPGLDRPAAERLIRGVAGGRSLPAELTAGIVARADGNPLFVEELTRTVLEAGLLRRGAGAYVADAPLADIAVPASLHDSLMARLDRLHAAKELALTAACIGREFDPRLLAEVAEVPEAEVEAALERLIAAQLVVPRSDPPGATYAFRHALIRDVAYDSLLRPRRRALHGRIAAAIERRFPDQAASHPDVLAQHCSLAGLAAPAAGLWLEAGRRAKERYANAEAGHHLRHCLRELDRASGDGNAGGSAAGRRVDPAESMRRDCLVMLGDLAGLAGEIEAANAAYRDALELADDPTARRSIANKMHRAASVVRGTGTIVYYEHGSGPKTLLFVNPLLYGLAVFQPLLERLCQEFRIITVDCRGTGGSTPLTRPYPLGEHVADLEAVIEAAGPPVIGVGISRSGNQLLRLAHSRPDLLERMVTVDMPLGSADPPPPLRYPADYLHRRWALLAEGDVEGLVRLQARYILAQPEEADAAKLWVENVLRLPRETVCVVPGCDGACSVLTRQEEDALWRQAFMAQPARRREFEPSSKRRKRRPASLPPATG